MEVVRQNTNLDRVKRQTTVFLSVLQIYNEQVIDLLPSNGTAKRQLRRNNEGTFFAEGLK